MGIEFISPLKVYQPRELIEYGNELKVIRDMCALYPKEEQKVLLQMLNLKSLEELEVKIRNEGGEAVMKVIRGAV